MIFYKEAVAALKAAWFVFEGDTVNPEVLQNRASICERCPKLAGIENLRAETSQLLGMLAEQEPIPDILRYKSCGVCDCSLLLMLPTRLDEQHEDTLEQAEARPKECWKTTRDGKSQEADSEGDSGSQEEV